MDQWLREEKTIDFVLTHLKDANFDAEFYASHENDIIQSFNNQFNTQLVTKRKSWKRILKGLAS